jgi:hypothetical protein
MAQHKPTYSSWANMKRRCDLPTSTQYKYYGGRGIRYCERWASFANFLDDMGERPERMTLDRIDPNGNYEPSNCRWLNNDDQKRNKRSVPIYEHNGKRMTLPQWAEETGIKYWTLRYRMNNGWSFEDAISLRPLDPAVRWQGGANAQ